ncbi:hypothetical protein [Loigolactobacillus backii]|uniref:Uncharacterized protein n=1 Tax=Loigolactobacillus backii TaxID=375175 RepID=A0A192H0P8_9LACO|nr:hypothetical protein [Loigolactobacillus backii]ANK61853.1 hypothetical protein AYR53_03155 [Loigolactobacillus backii]ANK68953.1 hypothetical protein AYR56_01570 [Loigolactobacillus backii]MDA5387481.1 hypothetical protein [Loigolactobacillus backii]MDA5390033.1 hypothetical protein [Loigolactobacillus backii]PIO82369.1 hypothetical protein BSQ39_01720 [Loigolactobacillus backii]
MLPNDIFLKSYYDLSNSVVSFIRGHKDSLVILCEGITDRIYLEVLFNPKKVKVISVGGKDSVRKVANLLSISSTMTNDVFQDKNIHVLGIIDTDDRGDNQPTYSSNAVKTCRWQINSQEDRILKLVDVDRDGVGNLRSGTHIEDILDSNIFYKALNSSGINLDNFKDIQINRGWKFTNLSNPVNFENVFIKSTGSNGESQKQKVRNLINNNKKKIAINYAKEWVINYTDQKIVSENNPIVNAIENVIGRKDIGVELNKEVKQSGYINLNEDMFFYRIGRNGELFSIAKGSRWSVVENNMSVSKKIKNQIKKIESEQVLDADENGEYFNRNYELISFSKEEVAMLLMKQRIQKFEKYFVPKNVSNFGKSVNK